MARINIEECWWTDPRREKLGSLLGSMLLADATVIRAWRLAQEFWGKQRGLVPTHVFETLEANANLIEANLAEVRNDGVYIRGSSQYHDWMSDRKAAARLGGQKSAEKRSKKSKQTATKSKQTQPSYSSSLSSSSSNSCSDSFISDEVEKRPSPAANRETWLAYSEAYHERYQIEPTRNAKVNAAIAGFVKRVGEQDAPAIARFFVAHNDSFYAKSTHTFSLALRDAESLRTQWLKGRAITQSDIRRFEKNQQQADLMAAIDRGECDAR